ncbi:hypothetical protein LTR53_000717 [Teratosphaeriaceae sp. CCFEE 6253]|nr:hypothetical protein LTR53_000717 [Teratosphaeriaceae sp. CCFEE 6253]
MEIPLVTSDNTIATSQSDRNELALPPSFELSVDIMKVSVKYHLRVVVERPGLLHKDLTAAREIVFRPLEPPDLPELLAGQPGLQRLMVHLCAEALDLASKPSTAGEAPPPYTSAIGFEITIPRCGLAHSGDHVALEMAFDVPKALQRSAGALWLTQLIIRVQAATTAIVGCRERTHLSYVNVCDVKGITPLEYSPERERSVVPPDLWAHQVYPHMLHSFVSGGVRRTHRLEVIASIMAQSTQETQTIAVGVGIVVKSGPLATYE